MTFDFTDYPDSWLYARLPAINEKLMANFGKPASEVLTEKELAISNEATRRSNASY